MTTHPLVGTTTRRAVERAASAHLGRPWRASGFADLNDRASHPCGILHGPGLSVFAKLDTGPLGREQFTAELRGLTLLRDRAGVATPVPVAEGVLAVDGGALLVLEAIPEVPAVARSTDQWRDIGYALAALHRVTDARHGLAGLDGFFGPLRQDNRPVDSDRWSDFYAERRLLPRLRSAVDSGHLPPELAAGIERIIRRLPALCGPEPRPTLLHGDAQQNNVLTGPAGPVLLDAAPHFGHPEVDLALVDYFAPVPAEVFDAYREVRAVDAGFGERRELWRLFGYLAVVTVDAHSPFGRSFLPRIADAVSRYR